MMDRLDQLDQAQRDYAGTLAQQGANDMLLSGEYVRIHLIAIDGNMLVFPDSQAKIIAYDAAVDVWVVRAEAGA